MQHLIFFDGECGLCDQVVQFVYQRDKDQIFCFAPLQGVTAAQYLKHLPPEIRFSDSLIFIENFRTQPKVWIYAQASFRIAWLLGGWWKLIGWLSYLPGWLFNWAYKLVAMNRHRLFPHTQCFVPPSNQKERFLN